MSGNPEADPITAGSAYLHNSVHSLLDFYQTYRVLSCSFTTTMSKFPQPWRSTVSHWQATNRGPSSLYGHGKDDKLPSEADVVIVGGGMMGSALSCFLTREGAYGAGKRVVCIEAKDLASGASGRNGGQ